MKKIIPIIAISIIIIYAGVLLTDKPMQKNSISNQVSEVKEPPLSSIVPKEVPKVTTSPKATPSSTPTKPTTTTPKPSTPTSNPNEYTLAQIATHNSSSSCWTIVNNNVYDLTSFVNEHPGGSGAIKRMCGKDGTSSFTDQHGGQRNPEQELASHKIGTLKK